MTEDQPVETAASRLRRRHPRLRPRSDSTWAASSLCLPGPESALQVRDRQPHGRAHPALRPRSAGPARLRRSHGPGRAARRRAPDVRLGRLRGHPVRWPQGPRGHRWLCGRGDLPRTPARGNRGPVGRDRRVHGSPALVITSILGSVAGIIFLVFCALLVKALIPAGLLQLAATGRFSAAFRVNENLGWIRDSFGTYVLMLLTLVLFPSSPTPRCCSASSERSPAISGGTQSRGHDRPDRPPDGRPGGPRSRLSSGAGQGRPRGSSERRPPAGIDRREAVETVHPC